MSSPERDLLIRHCNWMLSVEVHLQLLRETEALLAQPEQPERWSALNRQQVYEKGWRAGYEEKLLTQPEQTEQEPVAWRWKTHKRDYYIYSEDNYHELEGEPLYTSPLKREPFKPDWANYRQGVEDSKREPLSEAIVLRLFTEAFCRQGDINTNFARAIEKAHGIGGEDEE